MCGPRNLTARGDFLRLTHQRCLAYLDATDTDAPHNVVRPVRVAGGVAGVGVARVADCDVRGATT